MSLPQISVLMPTYNYASYLPEAITSVLAQDFRDFELLIIDDGSTDNTAGVVQPFCARDSRVKFSVNPSNLGMVNNWNKCLEQAGGSCIKFLFADDKLADPRALGKLLALLRDNPSAVLAASARAILDEKSNVTEIWRSLPDGCHRGRDIIKACLVQNENLVGEPSSVLFRKADARRGFDPKLVQIVDVEMWFRLLEQGDLAYTREPLCAFRRHTRQQTALNNDQGLAWREHTRFFTDYAARPWIPRRARFSILFALRRLRQKRPGSFTGDLLESEENLCRQLGKGWYFLYWLCYRMAVPFYNLKRSINKRRSRARLGWERAGRKPDS
jgi:glycosyltransferase involved in cell wall biosynthesis